MKKESSRSKGLAVDYEAGKCRRRNSSAETDDEQGKSKRRNRTGNIGIRGSGGRKNKEQEQWGRGGIALEGSQQERTVQEQRQNRRKKLK